MGEARSWLRQESGRLRSGWRLLLFLLAFSVAMIVINVAVRALGVPPQRVRGVDQPWSHFGIAALALVGTLLTINLLLRRLEQRSPATLGIPLERPWVRGLGVGLLLGVVPVALLGGLLRLTGHAEITAPIFPNGLVPHALLMALAVVCLSAMEELVFRGYLLQQLCEGLGRWPAVLITASSWGLLHGGNPGANPLGLINTAASGVLLGWLVLRTGSLWIAIGAHAGWNLAGAHLLGIRLSGFESGDSLLATELSGPAWLTGGDYGFEAGLPSGLIDVSTMSIAVLLARYLPGHRRLRSSTAPVAGSGHDASDARHGETDHQAPATLRRSG